MISLFLINDAPIGVPNPSTAKFTINGVTSDAQRSDSGDLKVLNKVNSIAKLEVSWDSLSIADMETLCRLFDIDIVEPGQVYEPKTLEQLTFKVTTRVPSGIRSFTAYVGDTLSGDLIDYSGRTDALQIGGERWENVSLNLIGTGEG